MSQETKGPKHDRILDAAVKVFARQGFHGSRISEIAAEADVASGTIYLYFRNKDDILISLFEESLERLIEEVKKDLKGLDDPVEKLNAFIGHHLAMLNEHKELGEVLQVELRQSHKFMKEYEPRHWIRYIDILAEILAEGQKKGVFRKDLSLGIFKRAVFGALDEIALHGVMTNRKAAWLDNAAEQLASLVLNGVAKDRKAEARPKSQSKNGSRKAASG